MRHSIQVRVRVSFNLDATCARKMNFWISTIEPSLFFTSKLTISLFIASLTCLVSSEYYVSSQGFIFWCNNLQCPVQTYGSDIVTACRYLTPWSYWINPWHSSSDRIGVAFPSGVHAPSAVELWSNNTNTCARGCQ